MARETLTSLLVRLRDGDYTLEDVERARALVQEIDQIPAELRAELSFEEPESEAAGVLALLGHDDLGEMLAAAIADELDTGLDFSGAPWMAAAHGAQPAQSLPAATPVSVLRDVALDEPGDPESVPIVAGFADAVRYEAGLIEVVDDVLSELGEEGLTSLALALRREAGVVDVVSAVMDAVQGHALPLAAAVHDEAGSVELAARVAADLGMHRLPLGEAVRAEAGRVEVAGTVLESLRAPAVPVAAAVRDEAGAISIAGAVLRELGVMGLPVADAVRYEAGPVDVAGTVSSQLGLNRTALDEAARAEAGTCDVVQAVLAEIGGTAALPLAGAIHAEAGEIDVVAEVMRRVRMGAEVPYVAISSPANTPWRWRAAGGALLSMAAAALITLFVSPFGGGGTVTARPSLEFAQQGEITVEDLEYGENVTVFEALGDEGAVIIWFEEEV